MQLKFGGLKPYRYLIKIPARKLDREQAKLAIEQFLELGALVGLRNFTISTYQYRVAAVQN